jgi:hypothetical protein
VRKSQRQPQPPEGNTTILGLRPPLGTFRGNSRRPVHEHNGRLHLVAMLAARAAAACPDFVALQEQVIGGQGGRVHTV